MDAVYNAGSIPVSADDVATKRLAARLQILGFFEVSEVLGDGSLRRLRPSETVRAELLRPWRIAKSGAGALMDDFAPLHSTG
jgi:flagella basal body P-ring formation protein FlgA